MRSRLTFLLLLLPLSFGVAQPSNVEQAAASNGVAWQPFEQAVAAAGQHDSKVLIFVYTDWCGWCRRLINEVYTDESVQNYMNTHFQLTRLDAESQAEMTYLGETYTESELAAGLGATGFPATIFLQGENEYITRLPGYLPAPQYLTVLKFIAEEAYLHESFEDFVKRHE